MISSQLLGIVQSTKIVDYNDCREGIVVLGRKGGGGDEIIYHFADMYISIYSTLTAMILRAYNVSYLCLH